MEKRFLSAYCRISQSGLNLYGGTVALDSYSIPVKHSGYNEAQLLDCVMIADVDTLGPVPWLERTGRVICDTMWYDGSPQLAAAAAAEEDDRAASSLGYNVMMGHEYRLRRRPKPVSRSSAASRSS